MRELTYYKAEQPVSVKLAAAGAVLFSGAATAGYGSRSELVGLSDSSHS